MYQILWVLHSDFETTFIDHVIIIHPVIGALLAQGIKSGKRKARSEEGEEGATNSKATGQPRKAVKRAQGHTPSRKGPALGAKGLSPAQKGPGPSPLRHLNGGRGAQGPSRLAHSTHISDIENAAKAANSSDQVIMRFSASCSA